MVLQDLITVVWDEVIKHEQPFFVLIIIIRKVT